MSEIVAVIVTSTNGTDSQNPTHDNSTIPPFFLNFILVLGCLFLTAAIGYLSISVYQSIDSWKRKTKTQSKNSNRLSTNQIRKSMRNSRLKKRMDRRLLNLNVELNIESKCGWKNEGARESHIEDKDRDAGSNGYGYGYGTMS